MLKLLRLLLACFWSIVFIGCVIFILAAESPSPLVIILVLLWLLSLFLLLWHD